MKSCGFCRVCGGIKRLHELEEREKNILHFIWNQECCTFSCDIHMICSTCSSNLMINHYKNYRYRNKGGYKKKGHEIAVWDDIKNYPVMNSLGKPIKLRLTKKGKNWIIMVVGNDLPENPPSSPPKTIVNLRRSERSRNVIRKLDENIREAKNKGLTECDSGEKGRGVKTIEIFKEGAYVTTYLGKIMKAKEANKLEKQNYLLYFSINQNHYCINANDELESYGLARLMNHSRQQPNLKPRAKLIEGIPYVYFTAKYDIPANTELLWDYGDKDTEIEWMNTT